MPTDSRERGSALIEVLVAFTIMSLAVITGYQIFSDAITRVTRARDRQAELASALQILATGALSGAGRIAASAGDGRQFTIDVEALAPDLAPWAQSRPLRLRIWSGTATNGPPLLETIVMSRVPQQ